MHKVLIFSFVASFLTYSNITAEPHVYFGLLHAHTSFSDGLGTPADAYAMAKNAGLDFFAVTEHNHAQAEQGAKERADGLLIATNPALYESSSPVTIHVNGTTSDVVSVTQAAKDATDASFVALYGQEFSTISSGNHVNVFNLPQLITVSDGAYRDLYEMLDTRTASLPPVVVQLNHPDVHEDLFYGGQSASTIRKMYNDYGIDDADFGPDFAELVRASDAHVSLIEILSGPAMATARAEHYRYTDAHDDDYYFYLTQGYHISPSAGQDNHYQTWGNATDARTGVYCDELSVQALSDAFIMNRTFATEDKNMSAMFKLNNATSMGDVVSKSVDDNLTFSVSVADADEQTSGYNVTLYYGVVEPRRRDEVRNWKAGDGKQETVAVAHDQSAVFANYVASGNPEFFYVEVEQQADGDRLWSAPIWINYPRGAQPSTSGHTYVWTKGNSQLYHDPSCYAVKQIKPENKVTGSNPPAGRQKHDCRPEKIVEQ